jgi:aminoglycoside 2'-N-acetyltransferase I
MTPELEIMVRKITDLNPREQEEMSLIDHLAFYEEDGDNDWWQDWSPSEICFLGKEEGKIVSNVGLITREVLVNGEPIMIGGIGGVMTRPDRQYRGYAAKLLEEAREFMLADPIYQFGMLFCEPKRAHFYSKAGYVTKTNPVFVRRDGKRKAFPDHFMVLELRGEPFPKGDVDCMGLPW